jgi:hypothetical protein
MKRISLLATILCAVSTVSFAAPPQMSAGADTNSIAFKDGSTEIVKINSTGTVSGATPTANEHFATKLYVDTQTAAASGASAPTYAGVTSGTYNGGSGIGTIDAACHAQYSGSRMARASDLLKMVRIPLPATQSWILCDNTTPSDCLPFGVHQNYTENCKGFTSNDGYQNNGYVINTSGGLEYIACNQAATGLCVIP